MNASLHRFSRSAAPPCPESAATIQTQIITLKLVYLVYNWYHCVLLVVYLVYNWYQCVVVLVLVLVKLV